MDNETKNILKILGVVVLFLLKPKKIKSLLSKASNDSDGVTPPKTESNVGISDKDFENATICLKAYRSAVNNGESKSELDELNKILMNDYGIKVFLDSKSGKLIARNGDGKDIAKEE
jgi:hypothetical protein